MLRTHARPRLALFGLAALAVPIVFRLAAHYAGLPLRELLGSILGVALVHFSPRFSPIDDVPPPHRAVVLLFKMLYPLLFVDDGTVGAVTTVFHWALMAREPPEDSKGRV